MNTKSSSQDLHPFRIALRTDHACAAIGVALRETLPRFMKLRGSRSHSALQHQPRVSALSLEAARQRIGLLSRVPCPPYLIDAPAFMLREQQSHLDRSITRIPSPMFQDDD